MKNPLSGLYPDAKCWTLFRVLSAPVTAHQPNSHKAPRTAQQPSGRPVYAGFPLYLRVVSSYSSYRCLGKPGCTVTLGHPIGGGVISADPLRRQTPHHRSEEVDLSCNGPRVSVAHAPLSSPSPLSLSKVRPAQPVTGYGKESTR